MFIPDTLELMCLPEVNSYANNISVFHWLFDFNILVRENLDLLATIPEAGVEDIQ